MSEVLNNFYCQVYSINEAAVKIVKECAYPEGALVAGGLSQTPTYITTVDKELVKAEVKKQLEVFKNSDVDLMICEVCHCFVLFKFCRLK